MGVGNVQPADQGGFADQDDRIARFMKPRGNRGNLFVGKMAEKLAAERVDHRIGRLRKLGGDKVVNLLIGKQIVRHIAVWHAQIVQQQSQFLGYMQVADLMVDIGVECADAFFVHADQDVAVDMPVKNGGMPREPGV